MQQGRRGRRRSTSTRRTAEGTVALLALALAMAGLLASCSGSDDAAPTTTTALVTSSIESLSDLDRSCEAAAALLYRDAAVDAADPDPDADDPAVAGLVPEQINGFLLDVKDQAEGSVAKDIDTVVAATKAFAESQELYSDEAQAAFDRVVVWAAGPCPPSKPVWACISPTSTVPGDADAPGPAATAEEAAGDAPGVVGTRTKLELADKGSTAAFAWIDDHQLVRRRVTVVPDGDGWRQLKVSTCPE